MSAKVILAVLQSHLVVFLHPVRTRSSQGTQRSTALCVIRFLRFFARIGSRAQLRTGLGREIKYLREREREDQGKLQDKEELRQKSKKERSEEASIFVSQWAWRLLEAGRWLDKLRRNDQVMKSGRSDTALGERNDDSPIEE